MRTEERVMERREEFLPFLSKEFFNRPLAKVVKG
jgi:hypothetical protein